VTETIRALAAIVGADNLRIDSDTTERYGLDWTRFYSADPLAVVFPRTIDAVRQLVVFANQQRISLVPSGGRTGLSGGAVARNQELVVSFDKMNRILAYDAVDHTVTLQAGVVTQQLQEFAEEKDLFYPVDFASSGSSQMGGNIATNAGGIKVLRFGLTRDWVAGLTVVTGAGEVLHLNKDLVKNATGYDLRHLFIGSEGTLGFIVEATIRLARPPGDLTVMLLAVSALKDIIEVLQSFRQKVALTAFEFFSEAALGHVLNHSGGVHPFASGSAYYVLLEFETRSLDGAMAAFEACMGTLVEDGVVSQSGQQRLALWRYREDISEAITAHTPYKNDVSVRISRVTPFLFEIEQKLKQEYPEFEIVWFGHIGDGNLHLNILKPPNWIVDDFKTTCEAVSERILRIVEKYEGSISAEHGVGLLKRDQLHFSRSQPEINLMKSIKQVFDPNNVMNPGKLISI